MMPGEVLEESDRAARILRRCIAGSSMMGAGPAGLEVEAGGPPVVFWAVPRDIPYLELGPGPVDAAIMESAATWGIPELTRSHRIAVIAARAGRPCPNGCGPLFDSPGDGAGPYCPTCDHTGPAT